MNLLLLATAWGSKFGGVNAFNADFAAGLAKQLGDDGRVFCAAFQPSMEDIRSAKACNVTLFGIDRDEKSPTYDESWALDVWESFRCIEPNQSIDWWIGHDVITGSAAIKGPIVTASGASAIIMHMNYADYQEYKSGVGVRARQKVEQQRAMFRFANRLFANGPLLRDALCDLLPGRQITMLVPGFPDVPIQPAKHSLNVITFGRMDRQNDRIKQGALAVASFASAVREARALPAGPPLLTANPQLQIYGIDSEGSDEESSLKAIAADRARQRLRILALPFSENRQQILSDLGRSNIALMLSWHEGFGLTGWEAIAAEVPLVITRRSGLWQLLEETFGMVAAGYVRCVNIRGQDGTDELDNFLPEDEIACRNEIFYLSANLGAAKRAATELKYRLKRELLCTWTNTANQFIHALQISTSGARSISARKVSPKFFGNFADWFLYGYQAEKDSTYYIASKPIKSVTSLPERRPVAVLVSRMQNASPSLQISVQPGFVFKERSLAKLKIDDKEWHLFTQGEHAWAGTDEDDQQIIQAMQRSGFLEVDGIASSGERSADEYSLSGFTEALKAMRDLSEQSDPAELASDKQEFLLSPRFASVNSDKIYVRKHPSDVSEVSWVFEKPKIPVAITEQFGTWCRIVDFEGDNGWVQSEHLSWERTVLVTGSTRTLLDSTDKEAQILAMIDPGNFCDLLEIHGAWCRVRIKQFEGWLECDHVFGISFEERYRTGGAQVDTSLLG